MRAFTTQTPRRRPAVIERGALHRRHRPDYWILILSVVLLSIGLVVIYSISPGLAINSKVSQNYYINRQMIAVLLGVAAFIVTANTPISWWRKTEKILIGLAVLSAIAVRLFGQQVLGAYRWIQVGGFSFQSNELIKFALLIWLAAFLADRIKDGTMQDGKRTFQPLLIALVAVGVVVAGVQSDLGSTGVMVAMMATMVFVAGLPMKRIVMVGGIVVIGAILAVTTTGYRKQRLETYLHPEANCQTTGYQVCQALIAVGSGGMIGLGLGRSVQAYGYLPEAANDSIFAIYAEKFGLVGCLLLLALFVALFARIKRVIERAPDDFSRLLVTGILAWLSVQSFINIGAMIGLLPLKGITLPFISYGGTSILFVTAAIGIVFQISKYTAYSVPRLSVDTEGSVYEGSRDGSRFRRTYNANISSRS